MWFLRRMIKIFYMDKVTNEEVLKRAQTNRSFMKDIRKRQFMIFLAMC